MVNSGTARLGHLVHDKARLIANKPLFCPSTRAKNCVSPSHVAQRLGLLAGWLSLMHPECMPSLHLIGRYPP
jgi:hypothetical protein